MSQLAVEVTVIGALVPEMMVKVPFGVPCAQYLAERSLLFLQQNISHVLIGTVSRNNWCKTPKWALRQLETILSQNTNN